MEVKNRCNVCDGSLAGPARYECTDCRDVNLCVNCYWECKHAGGEHQCLEIRLARPPRPQFRVSESRLPPRENMDGYILKMFAAENGRAESK